MTTGSITDVIESIAESSKRPIEKIILIQHTIRAIEKIFIDIAKKYHANAYKEPYPHQ